MCPLDRYLEAAGAANVPAHPEAAAVLHKRSRFLLRAVTRDPAMLDEAVGEPPRQAEEYHTEAAALPRARIGPALRRWRLRETLRIVLTEDRTRDLRQAMTALSALADASIQAALDAVVKATSARFGPPPCAPVIMGMGKLGSCELNLSSDVDLIFFYAEDVDHETHGWFRRAYEQLTTLLSERTEDGFVYRVDIGLRPEGRTGPICNSLTAAEHYYEAFGHPWERIAWLRARPVAGDLELGHELLDRLTPFVYRRHLDLKAIDEVRAMKAAIDAAATRAERNVKLGPGGIREVEFFAQALQLVHGGRHPALRTRDTIGALERLALAGLITGADRAELADAYLFLRAVEHQLQLVEERQTHELPSSEGELEFVATALDFPSATAFLEALDERRLAVQARWRDLFAGADRPEDDLDAVIKGDLSSERLAAVGLRGERVAEHLRALRRSPRSPLHPAKVVAQQEVARALLAAVARGGDPDQTLLMLRDFVRHVRPRSGLWRFAESHPERLAALIHLMGTSRFLGTLVARDPALLEQVVLGAGGPPRWDRATLAEALGAQLPGSAEEALVALRTRHAAQLLRIGFYDVAGELDQADVEAQLSLLAEETVSVALDIVTRDVAERFGEPSGRFAVVGLGKLGAAEMTYGSDLDLLFLLEGDHVAWSRLSQRLVNALSLRMATGRLYEVDMRLRPSGNCGPLLVTPEALQRHYRGRAATWERQALLRARLVAGHAGLGHALRGAIAEVLGQPHDDIAVRAEVDRIRRRLQDEVAREAGTMVDFKYGSGGLVEVDLTIQTLRLLRSPLEPRAYGTREALSALEAAGALDEDTARPLREGYDFLRRLESRVRIALGRPATRLDLSGAETQALAKRLGYHDLPGRTAAEGLDEAYRRRTAAVRQVYEQVMRP